MNRGAVLVVCVCVAACVTAADEKDPVRDKLFAAKVAYDKETASIRKSTTGWFDKREDAARRAGDKKALDAVKADRSAFEEDGLLPKTVPPELKQKHERADKALDTAYAEAVKAYTKARNDERATEVEQEWKGFSAKAYGIDLIALVDPKAGTVLGEWKKEKTALVGVGADNKRATLQFPYEPGEEYDLEVKCKRAATQYFGVGLVAGGRQVEAVIEDWPQQGGKNGFSLVDGKSVEDNSTTVKGMLLKNNQSHSLVYSVRNEKIDVTLDGKGIFSYKGSFSHLSASEYARVPNKKALFLMIGGNSAFQFDSLVVKLVKGKGTIVKQAP
jgi:hypothetical protein